MNKLFIVLLLSSALLLGCLDFLGSKPSPTPVATPAPTVAATATPAPTQAPTLSPTAAPDSTVYAEADKIVIIYGSFTPPAIKVKAGTRVTWENQDGRIHSVRSKEGAPAQFNSFNIPGRQTYSYTFSTAGRYAYYNELGGGAEGVVLVE